MNKLRLRLDDLQVDSFETAQTVPDRGTVYANADSNARCNSEVSCLPDTCYWETCMDCAHTIGGCTGENTCGEVGCITEWTVDMQTCQFSCDPTCTC